MQASIDLLSLVFILGSTQCLFLALIFWRADRGNRKANRALALFFVVLPLATMNGILYRTGLYRSSAFLIGLEPAFRLLMGPVLFLYVERLVSPSVPMRRSLPRHIGGALLLMPLCLPFYLQDPVFKMLFVEVWLRNGSYTAAEYFNRFWYEIAFELQLWIYLVAIWLKVHRYEAMIRDTYSSIESITLAWMRKLLLSFAIALAAGTVSYVLFFLVITFRYMYLFAPLAAAFSAYYISYKAFHEPDVFLVTKPALGSAPTSELRRKYEKSGISEEDGNLLLSRLDRVVKARRPFADPDLTLPRLAALLQASPHHLSQLLNQRLGTSFYDYVNALRVEEVKRCLSDPGRPDGSVLDIALECGFNSKSAFNRIFKQQTSLSPTQFRQRSAAPRVVDA